jgi:hypothetical protein
MKTDTCAAREYDECHHETAPLVSHLLGAHQIFLESNVVKRLR